MKINQVEELVGITKKNIRFYEDEGLICPNRDPGNGYREYSLKDVDDLLKIKLLRKINIPIEEIKLLQGDKITWSEVLDKHLSKLQQEQINTDKLISLCNKLKADVSSLDSLNASDILTTIEYLEKGGTPFMNIEKTDIKKKDKHASTIAAICFSLFCLFMIVAVIVASKEDPISIWWVLLILSVPVTIIICVIVSLLQRYKEIEKGEEYEARKY